MVQGWHKLTEINPKTRKAYCSECKKIVKIEVRQTVKTKINWRCSFNSGRRKHKDRYRLYRKEFCEGCGFIPVHFCQLDVDHIDGDHNNNHPNNLMTLCANCHRLKTWQERNK